ncbi:MAG: hypothetical protein QM773_20090 [Hyphomonadaceae bacterium]
MPDQAWDAIWVILGACIATATTYFFNRSLEYKQRRAHAFSLFIKAFTAANDVFSANVQLQELLKRFKDHTGRDPAPHEVWSAVTPFVANKYPEIQFTAEELSLFDKDGEAIGKLLEFLRLRQILLDALAIYSDKRAKLTQDLASLTSFRNEPGGLVGATTVNSVERPDLHREIVETNKLSKDVLALALEGSVHARRLCDLVNQRLPKAFREGDFSLSMSLPRASD